MINRVRKILLRSMAVLMVLLVAAPASGLGQLLMLCSMTGELGPECCCGHSADGPSTTGPALTSGSCCELVSSADILIPARAEAPPAEVETEDTAVVSAGPCPEARSHGWTRLIAPEGSRGPPPGADPPLYISNCALLI